MILDIDFHSQRLFHAGRLSHQRACYLTDPRRDPILGACASASQVLVANLYI